MLKVKLINVHVMHWISNNYIVDDNIASVILNW
jgi:hypothetical protein